MVPVAPIIIIIIIIILLLLNIAFARVTCDSSKLEKKCRLFAQYNFIQSRYNIFHR